MLNGAFKIGFAAGRIPEEVGDYFLPAQRSKSEWRDEFARAACHHHLDVVAFLLQTAHEFRGFISRYAAGDTQRDSHFFLPAGATSSSYCRPCPRRRKLPRENRIRASLAPTLRKRLA